jgi:enamine deaminase RidA (YjgF/YER057c/UK114 family)
VTRERTEALETACRKAGIDVDAVLDDTSHVTHATRAERHRELAGRLLQILEEPS